MLEILKAVVYGIVEGITEWLPVSSTGHMILLEELMPMEVAKEFWNMFLVVVQLGAILAVVLLFWNRIFPFRLNRRKQVRMDWDIMNLWGKILVACIPAGIVGVLFDDWLEEHLYNFWVVAVMLIAVGMIFILVENRNRGMKPIIRTTGELDYRIALLIGLFQLAAAVFPGTSRSGATIIGALMVGVSRTVAAEFTFYLAIPVMFGASLLKLLKFGFAFTGMELGILFTGMAVSFVVSIVVIRFLMGYIKRHDFKVFGWYRIVLGAVVLLYFGLIAGIE
ncbi:undecaprenyl-diphosphate phosphatase [Lachnospiraceae bacterium JLR.KK009]|jgi:undecaprenyl-diphosphatase|nr:undecaprenyl-diphosphatase UppP [Lachnospiraceae bacterium A2]MCI8707075.1 undecaprenyl-diphosphate phosphatase [Lachnospiraceae bacterium]MCI8883073.1 undecaprenyl-diphosphate phosphatase [Lachnospiraceae bacterium]